MPVKSGPEGESSKEIRRQVQARVEEERSKYVSPQAPLELPSSFVLSCLDAIEDGDMILAEALVRSHVDALKRKMPEPEAAILGCTHYPLMEKEFQAALGAGVKVFSQGNLVADSLADYLDRHPDMIGTGNGGYFTTGDPARVSDRATQFLRREIRFQAA